MGDAPLERGPDSVYRPLSGLALAAIILAIVYGAFLTLVLTAAWFMRGSPLVGFWSLILPCAAAGLAWAAKEQIRRSEGTRAGEALVQWSIIISALFATIYAGIYVATYVGLKMQTSEFATEWFTKIEQGQLGWAFLRTQSPDERQDVSPTDMKTLYQRYGGGKGASGKGPLPTFLANELVTLLQRSGQYGDSYKSVAIEDQGIRSWEPNQAGYHVVRVYRLTTPEGQFDVQVGLRSDDRKSVRRWSIIDSETDIIANPTLTPLGQALRNWRDEAAQFAGVWVRKRSQGDLLGMYLDAREAHERPRLERTCQAYIIANHFSAQASAALGDPQSRWLWPPLPENLGPLLPGYQDLLTGSLVETASLEASAKFKDEVLAESRSCLQSSRWKAQAAVLPPQPLRIQGQQMQFAQEVTLTRNEPGRLMARYVCEARLVVETDPGEFTPTRKPQWRWVRLELLRVSEPPEESRPRQGGPR